MQEHLIEFDDDFLFETIFKRIFNGEKSTALHIPLSNDLKYIALSQSYVKYMKYLDNTILLFIRNSRLERVKKMLERVNDCRMLTFASPQKVLPTNKHKSYYI